jgi:methyl-accepting chemotaxis protein
MKINDMGVGTRLGAGFSLVMLLMVAMVVTGVIYLRGMMADTHTTTSNYLVRERLSTEWLSIIDTNAALGLVVMTSGDEGVKQYAADAMKKNSARASVVQKELVSLVISSEGEKLMKAVADAREAYNATRNEVLKISAAGNAAETGEVIRTRLLPSMKAYSVAVHAVVKNQQDSIDGNSLHIQQSGSSAVWTLCAVGLVALILSVLLALFISRSIVIPLRSAVAVSREVAAGNLTINVEVNSKDQLGQLMGALREMTESLRNTVMKVREGSDSISSAANEIALGNQELSSRTEEQAASVEQTAATLEQLTATLNNTASHTASAREFVSETTALVKANGTMMSDVSSGMKAISDSSSKMSGIISVIDGIAFQTNILALNAAVEAARAGESGRGFAVVAGEVRSLAQRSASAASEIKALIDDSVTRIDAGNVLVNRANQGMSGIVSNVNSIEQLIIEIAQAASEQNDGIAQINIAMEQIDTTTQQNAALVEESATAAHSMAEHAAIMGERVSTFRLDKTPATREPAITLY